MMLFSARIRGGVVVLMAALLAVVGCDCSDGTSPARLEILYPEDGQRITLADDVDTAAPGVQIEVVAESRRLGADDAVALYVDLAGDVPEDGDTPIASASPDDAGMVDFGTVTLTNGVHRLQAFARDGGVQSQEVEVTIVESCATITFASPEPPSSGELTLGPSDDTDGEACGETFETSVVVSTDAGDGRPATLFVNGTPRATTTVEGTIATFEGVVLDNRGSTPNSLAVEVENADGITCRESFPGDVLVDCEGVSCAITTPDTASAYLNASDDVSDEEGFQADFVVSTDDGAIGEPVRLVVDGDESGAREASAAAAGSGAEALFGNVSLSEGVHRVRAQCRDAAGNTTSSGIAEWTVDITPCDVTIASPTEGQVFIDDDDEDSTTDGVQITLSGTASGDGCARSRASMCDGIGGTAFGGLTDGSFDHQLTLSGATPELCAEVEDEAGNVGEARVTVVFSTDAPQVEIVSPSTATSFNRDGGTGYTADLDLGSTSCEAMFVVNCTGEGEEVVLRREGETTPLPGGTATCVATSGLPSPYVGQATFADVTVPNGTATNIVAVQTVDRLTGVSAAVTLGADCEDPVLAITRPSTCPTTLRPSTDDENTATSDFEYRVDVLNANDGPPDVTLTITNSSGTAIYTDAPGTRVGLTNRFSDANFGSGGELTVGACATDSFGNTGCAAPCTVQVVDLPTVVMTDPAEGALLGAAQDCDTGTAGMQVRVRATTDAATGSTATVRIGSGTPVATSVGSGGVVDECVDAMDGSGLTIRVEITDTRGTGVGTRTVTIDGSPPDTAISDLAVDPVIVDRRGGVVRLTWDAVADVGGGMLTEYFLRCAAAPITDEAEWTAASTHAVTVAPGSGGSSQSDEVGGFRLGEERFCTLRAADAVGQMTPIGNSPSVLLEFIEVEVTPGVTGMRMGYALTPVGDVNGDGIDDFLAGGRGAAFLYFGSDAGLSATPSVHVTGSAAAFFGTQVAGLGDFNGDGPPDFAVAAFADGGLKGRVYVFYGRTGADPWPATISADAGGCGASLCFRSDDGGAGGPDESAYFGRALSGAGDFNGDGLMDLAVGAPGANSLAGRVYVLLGSDGFGSGAIVDVPGPAGSEPSGFVVDAPAMTGQMGIAAAGMGDVVGGARGDIAIGAAGDGGSIPGRAFTVAGRAYSGSGLLVIADPLEIDSAAGFGTTIANVGDYDGNGRNDVAVYGTAGGGKVTVFLQGAGGFSPARSFVLTNDLPGATGDQFGGWISLGAVPGLGWLGDVDQDGLCDLWLGSRERGSGLGAADLLYSPGYDTDLVRSGSHFTAQPASSEAAATRVAQYAGDLNGDGYPDLLVGDAAQAANDGRVLIYY